MNSLNNSRKIYFRLDCGGLIGYGHLSRCLSVAEEFSKNLIEPVFIIRKRPSLKELKIPFQILWLDEASDVNSLDPNYWRVGSEQNELEEILPHLSPNATMVLDHYGLGHWWQKNIRLQNHKLVLFQDIFNPDYEADMIINYTVGAEDSSYPLTTHVNMLGPQYTPLSQQYGKMHRLRFKKNTDVKIIGIYLGGIKSDYVKLLAEAMNDYKYFNDKQIEWIVNTEAEKELIFKFYTASNLKLHVRLPSLIDLYERTHLFIGTCGVSSLERACMGLWQLNFSVADNQSANVRALVENKLGFFLGDIRTHSVRSIQNALDECLKVNEEEKFQRTEKLFKLIDGNGAAAIADSIIKEGL